MHLVRLSLCTLNNLLVYAYVGLSNPLLLQSSNGTVNFLFLLVHFNTRAKHSSSEFSHTITGLNLDSVGISS